MSGVYLINGCFISYDEISYKVCQIFIKHSISPINLKIVFFYFGDYLLYEISYEIEKKMCHGKLFIGFFFL